MEQFPTLLMHMFGPRWWQSGGLSLYFRYATTLTDPTEGTDIAGTLMMLRFMKASSLLWSSDIASSEGLNR
jgi:hypothetical protein